MILTSLLIPAWKTRDFTLPVSHLRGDFVIYLRRLGFFYMKNDKGVKVKFAAKDESEKAFYDQVYSEKRPVSVGLITLVTQ